jgi:hypothetical protein
VSLVAVVVAGVIVVGAQEKAKPAEVAAATPAATAAPALTDLEQAYKAILDLRTAYARLLMEADACRAQLGPLRAKAATDELTADEENLKTLVEGNHPGYRWDPKTGRFDKVEVPATTPPPPKPPKPPEKK